MRFAAIVLLSLMCIDLGMDLWLGETGEFYSGELVLSTAHTGQSVLDISVPPLQPGSKDFHHECFCCCSHIEQHITTIIAVYLESGPSYSSRSIRPSDTDLSPIYHPPQFTI